MRDLKAERKIGTEAVLEMRRRNQDLNDKGGYDIVVLPGGKRTRVFTKKEFRIDAEGKRIVYAPMERSARDGRRKGGKGRGRKGESEGKVRGAGNSSGSQGERKAKARAKQTAITAFLASDREKKMVVAKKKKKKKKKKKEGKGNEKEQSKIAGS